MKSRMTAFIFLNVIVKCGWGRHCLTITSEFVIITFPFLDDIKDILKVML